MADGWVGGRVDGVEEGVERRAAALFGPLEVIAQLRLGGKGLGEHHVLAPAAGSVVQEDASTENGREVLRETWPKCIISW